MKNCVIEQDLKDTTRIIHCEQQLRHVCMKLELPNSWYMKTVHRSSIVQTHKQWTTESEWNTSFKWWKRGKFKRWKRVKFKWWPVRKKDEKCDLCYSNSSVPCEFNITSGKMSFFFKVWYVSGVTFTESFTEMVSIFVCMYVFPRINSFCCKIIFKY